MHRHVLEIIELESANALYQQADAAKRDRLPPAPTGRASRLGTFGRFFPGRGS